MADHLPDQAPLADPRLRYLLSTNNRSDGIDNIDALIKVVKQKPSSFRARYWYYDKPEFDYLGQGQGDNLLPLDIAIRRHAPVNVINAIYRTFPEAVREKDDYDRAPMHIACKKGSSLDVISLLYEGWPGVLQDKDGDGQLPLHCACIGGVSLEVISFLLERCPEAAEAKDEYGSTPLLCALEYERFERRELELFALLLKKSPAVLMTRNEDGHMPLHIACERSSLEVVSFLFERYPAAVEAKDIDRRMPLHIACENETFFDVIWFLLEKYPTAVNLKDRFLKRPLDYLDEDHEAMAVLTGFTQLIKKNIDIIGATQIMQECIKRKWLDGVVLVLDTCPSILQMLEDLDMKVIPNLLFLLGRRCKMLTVWSMIRHRQDILKID